MTYRENLYFTLLHLSRLPLEELQFGAAQHLWHCVLRLVEKDLREAKYLA